MAEHKVHEGTVPTIQGNIQPQMAMSPHHFNELQIKLRAQGVFSQIRVFSRQENKRYQEWVRDMERAWVILRTDNRRMQVLAWQSLGARQQSFAQGYYRMAMNLNGRSPKRGLRRGTVATADMLYARKSLRHLKKRKGTVSKFFMIGSWQ